ncbi:hypothetical protein FSARC_12779 [Fusarium sarcochroum]|uniref:Uncharacterized protein n=1 Tax=Fusarium sarcochroum TaxID=1208366 RepID=A0A8H4T604_9HYPO|nr:hypothetical protein FSARC_12779 [Fusarium sarcochroum]
MPKKSKVYPVGTDDREIIRETIGNLMASDKAEGNTNQALLAFPVFVMWQPSSSNETHSPAQRKKQETILALAQNLLHYKAAKFDTDGLREAVDGMTKMKTLHDLCLLPTEIAAGNDPASSR